VKLGVNIRNFGPSATPDALLGWARFAEDAGFAVAMMSDHVASTPDVEDLYPAPFYDPFTTLAWLAGQTTTVELGTTVAILPYRNPLQTARVVANIDQFSGGRFILGVGVGWSKPEFEALGLPFTRRGAMTDEYLEALTALWTNDRVSHRGEFLTFDDVSTGPRPARTPHPPIWVGGTAPAAIRRAARFGDAWHPNNARLEWLRETGLPTLRDAAREVGRATPALAPRLQIRVTDGRVDTPDRQAGTGTVEQIGKDLDEIAALGAEYLVLDTNPDEPDDSRPVTDDWRILETVATYWRDSAHSSTS
jgi:probable F420-dependent oxidoreductase